MPGRYTFRAKQLCVLDAMAKVELDLWAEEFAARQHSVLENEIASEMEAASEMLELAGKPFDQMTVVQKAISLWLRNRFRDESGFKEPLPVDFVVSELKAHSIAA